MPCKCTNDDGSLSDRCLGLCLQHEMIKQHNLVQERDPLNGLIETIAARLDKQIDYKLQAFHFEMRSEEQEQYNDAFLKGLKEGIAIGKEYNDY